MKKYNKFIFENTNLSNKTLGDKLLYYYENNNNEKIRELIGFNKDLDFDYKLDYKLEYEKKENEGWGKYLTEIYIKCDNDIDNYLNMEIAYISYYSELKSSYNNYEHYIDDDEINYMLNDENISLLKKILKKYNIEFNDNNFFDKLYHFFKLSDNNIDYLISDIKAYISQAYEKSLCDYVNEKQDIFFNDGFDIDSQNDRNYPINITLYINDLPKANTFKEIFDKHISDIYELEEFTYSVGVYDKYYKEMCDDIKQAINNFIEKDEEIEIINLDFDNIKTLGGDLLTIIKSYEWQEKYIDKYTKNADNRYKNLVNNNIINNKIKEKYEYLIQRNIFNI